MESLIKFSTSQLPTQSAVRSLLTFYFSLHTHLQLKYNPKGSKDTLFTHSLQRHLLPQRRTPPTKQNLYKLNWTFFFLLCTNGTKQGMEIVLFTDRFLLNYGDNFMCLADYLMQGIVFFNSLTWCYLQPCSSFFFLFFLHTDLKIILPHWIYLRPSVSTFAWLQIWVHPAVFHLLLLNSIFPPYVFSLYGKLAPKRKQIQNWIEIHLWPLGI